MKYYHTIKELVNATCSRFAERDAFIFKTEKGYERKKFGEFQRDCQCFSSNLLAKDVKNVHIALIGSTSYECLTALFGSMMASNTVVVPDCNYPIETMKELLKQTDIEYIIYQDSCKEKAMELLKETYIKAIFSIEDLLNSEVSETVEPLEQEPSQPAIILFTSGTTGKSKAVVLTNDNISSNACALADYLNADHLSEETGNVSIAIQPIHHSMFLGFVLSQMQQAVAVYFNTDIALILDDLKIIKPTILTVIPALVEQIYNVIIRTHKKNPDQPILKVVQEVTGGKLFGMTCGSAKLNPKLIEAFWRWGIVVKEGYGMTEASPTITISSYSDFKIGSVGKPLPGVEVKIVDGEVWTKSKCIMPGYYKDQESTDEIMEDGWLKTGDLGYLDEDGYLFITGRIKNLIILSNGENVSPEELEQLLTMEDIITEAVVFEKNGMIAAEIYCQSWQEYSEEELGAAVNQSIRTVNGKLPSYKKIQTFQIRKEAFPKNRTKKIMRTDIGMSDYIVFQPQHIEKTIPTNQDFDSTFYASKSNNDFSKSQLEEKLLEIFKRELDVTDAKTNDNLFELGGNSLTVRRIVNDIQYGLNIPITVSSVFDYPNVQELAEYICTQSDIPDLNVMDVPTTKENDTQDIQTDDTVDEIAATVVEQPINEDAESNSDTPIELSETSCKMNPASSSTLEEKLIEIFERELSIDSIQTTDNLFELGGNSLIVRRIVYDIQYELNIPLTVSSIFDYPTISELVHIIEEMDLPEQTDEVEEDGVAECKDDAQDIAKAEPEEDMEDTMSTASEDTEKDLTSLETISESTIMEEESCLEADEITRDDELSFDNVYPKDSVVLPIKYPIVTSFTYHANLLSILGTKRSTYEWILSNYIQVYCYKEISKHYFGDFYFPGINQIYPAENCPWITRQLIHVNTLKNLNIQILDFIMQSIDDGYYVNIVLNHFYIKSSIYYQNEKLPHDVFITGYNKRERVFYANDFLFRENVQYADTTITFDEFIEAYEDCSPEHPHNLYKGIIYLLKLKESADFTWNEHNLIHSLRNYYEGKMPEHWEMYHDPEEPEVVFGMNMYDALVLYLEEGIEKKFDNLDHREYFVMADHKHLMMERLSYFKEKIPHLRDHFVTLEKQYKDIHQIANDVVALIVKFDMISNIDHIANAEILKEALAKVKEMRVLEEKALGEFFRSI